jgi:chromosomal replication initiation ATPase DnaA
MNPTNETVKSALTAALEPQTKAQPINTKDWAGWLKIQTHSDPEIEALIQKCAEFALAFNEGRSPRWLTIMGNSGTGKTHCARRLWNHLSARLDWRAAGFVQSEIYWPKFVSELRSGDAFDQFRDMWKWPALFLDDICAERDTTGFTSEQLNTLLGCRENKWTVITSNKLLHQIAELEPRLADRIIRAPNIFIEVNTKSHALRHVEA